MAEVVNVDSYHLSSRAVSFYKEFGFRLSPNLSIL